MNFTPGGLLGYCSSKCMTSLNVPSSKGVSTGPMMTAFLGAFGQCTTFNMCSMFRGHTRSLRYRQLEKLKLLREDLFAYATSVSQSPLLYELSYVVWWYDSNVTGM